MNGSNLFVVVVASWVVVVRSYVVTYSGVQLAQCAQFMSSQFGRDPPIESLPMILRCLRFLTSVLIRSRSRSRSRLRSAREPIKRLRQMPAAATEFSIGSCIGRCRRTIFCIRWSGLGYIASGHAIRMANHQPRGYQPYGLAMIVLPG